MAVSNLPQSLFWRAQVGLFKTLYGAFVNIGAPGTADIVGCLRGRAVAIECKRATGDQQVSQERFQAAWESAGGFYMIGRDVETVLAALAAI